MNSQIKSQPSGDVLLSYKQAASLLNVCSRTVRRMVDAGQLAVVRIRRRVFFRSADILRIQEEGIP
jgi:excisionase family DNA binding protein